MHYENIIIFNHIHILYKYTFFLFIAISLFRVLKTTSKALPTTPGTPTTPRNESPNRSGLQSSKSENLDKLGPLSPGSVQANPATYAAVEMTVLDLWIRNDRENLAMAMRYWEGFSFAKCVQKLLLLMEEIWLTSVEIDMKSEQVHGRFHVNWCPGFLSSTVWNDMDVWKNS